MVDALSAQVHPALGQFKPRDVEELVDFYFHRRLAARVVSRLAKTSVTPDQLTYASGLSAVAGGIAFGTATPERSLQTLLGVLLFLGSVVLDCADGQLARARGISSYAGRMLDGVVDAVSVTAILGGQLAWLVAGGMPLWLGVVVGWATGLSFKWHAHRYDHVKNVYLHNVDGSRAKACASPQLEEIDREREEHERAGHWFKALLCRGFRRFTLAQRRGLAGRSGLDVPAQQTFDQRRRYRDHFRRFMRLWTFNGMGTHMEILMLGCLLSPLYSPAPLLAWAMVAGPMNLYTLYLKREETRLEATFGFGAGC